MPDIVLIAHNLRSAHNVGSLLRSADGFGVKIVYLTGYTPYPRDENDPRLPHVALKVERRISKTALGAEQSVDWAHESDISRLIENLRQEGFLIAALEQTKGALNLADFKSDQKIALIVGREVEGIEPEVLETSDIALEIAMLGQKESLNVANAAAIALYHLRFKAMPHVDTSWQDR